MRLGATKAAETSGQGEKNNPAELPASLAGREEGTGGWRGCKRGSGQGGKNVIWILHNKLSRCAASGLCSAWKSKPPGP